VAKPLRDLLGPVDLGLRKENGELLAAVASR
jgi:hypothetical protein